MKAQIKNFGLITLGLYFSLITSCSSSSDQQAEDNAELEANSEENLGNMENTGDGSDNFSDSTENGATAENNLMSENNVISNNNLANLTGNNSTAMNATSTEALDPGIVESVPTNPSLNAAIAQNPATTNIASMPMNAAAASNIASTPSTTPAATPMTAGAGKVKYVLDTSVAMVDQPSNGAAVVGTLDKGDHPLVVSESAEYVMLSNGKYVPAKSLSEKGVGRAKKDGIWK